ncbi:MAG: hypothetical protein ACLUDU_07760 [Butyricimonas faecihominis]
MGGEIFIGCAEYAGKVGVYKFVFNYDDVKLYKVTAEVKEKVFRRFWMSCYRTSRWRIRFGNTC